MRRGFGTTHNTTQQRGAQQQVQAQELKLLEGTDEQQAVWEYLLHEPGHLIVEAVAGSGKTTTIVQYAAREKYRTVGLVAFNKHIADELKLKVAGLRNVECMTYHSLGFKAVRARFGRVQLNKHKVLDYADGLQLRHTEQEGKLAGRLLDRDEQKTAKYRIASMCSYAKSYGWDETVTKEQLEWLEDRHDVDLNGLKPVVLQQVPLALKWCKDNTATIDFDDMVWLPYVLKLPVQKYDVLCVDEYQDTATTQQWLAVQAAKRLCAVGDSRQAIYGFRGADSKGFERLREQLGATVQTLPLTLTRRCPKSHVLLAQTIVPEIRAMEDAPEGKISWQSTEQAVENMKPGDLVVCRVNAALLSTAYRLLKKGVRAVVRGRDIGQGITKLLDKAENAAGGTDANIAAVLASAATITSQEVSKLQSMPNGRGDMRAAAAQDTFECLSELAQQVQSTTELRGVLSRLFSEFDDDGAPKNAVVLGTVHRTKGLEGARVYVLRPELIPHPMARKQQDREQEHNLAYVTVTRAKFDKSSNSVGELVFVGGECALFPQLVDEQKLDLDVVEFTAPVSGGPDDQGQEAPEGWD